MMNVLCAYPLGTNKLVTYRVKLANERHMTFGPYSMCFVSKTAQTFYAEDLSFWDNYILCILIKM